MKREFPVPVFIFYSAQELKEEFTTGAKINAFYFFKVLKTLLKKFYQFEFMKWESHVSNYTIFVPTVSIHGCYVRVYMDTK